MGGLGCDPQAISFQRQVGGLFQPAFRQRTTTKKRTNKMKVIVKAARMGFNDIFQAKSIKGGKPRYSITAICMTGGEETGNPDGLVTTIVYENTAGQKVEKPFDMMQKICEHVAKEKWGKVPNKLKIWAFNQADGSTTRDEQTNEDGEYWAGINAATLAFVMDMDIASVLAYIDTVI